MAGSLGRFEQLQHNDIVRDAQKQISEITMAGSLGRFEQSWHNDIGCHVQK